MQGQLHPRVELLRRLDLAPIVRALQQPNLHVLCDAPMAVALADAGLPASCMTQGLEAGEFLSDGFQLPVGADATIVIATRRSEEAVSGVLQARGWKTMPLFGQLLLRRAARRNRISGPSDQRAAPAATARLLVLAMPWSAAPVLTRELARLTGMETVDIPLSLVLALSEDRAASGFEAGPWWRMLTRFNTSASGALLLQAGWPELQAFLATLGPEERSWLEREFARFHIAQLCRDPAEAAAAEAVREDAESGVDAVSMRERRTGMIRATEAMAAFVAGTGAGTTVIDAADLCAAPTGTARRLARAAGLQVAGIADAPAESVPRQRSPRFDRLLGMAMKNAE